VNYKIDAQGAIKRLILKGKSPGGVNLARPETSLHVRLSGPRRGQIQHLSGNIAKRHLVPPCQWDRHAAHATSQVEHLSLPRQNIPHCVQNIGLLRGIDRSERIVLLIRTKVLDVLVAAKHIARYHDSLSPVSCLSVE